MRTIIAAVSDNGVIGANGTLPWKLPEDLKRFKALTMGHTLVMGRKTFDSIGRPLPGRTTIVLTRDLEWSTKTCTAHPGVIAASDMDVALAAAPAGREIFIIGGGEIYAQTMKLADRLEITHVKAGFEGDVFFPAIDPDVWEVEKREVHFGLPDPQFAFVTYARK